MGDVEKDELWRNRHSAPWNKVEDFRKVSGET